MTDTQDLDLTDILEWEFEYARETAAQAQNDRTTVVNLYLLLVGGVGSVSVALPQLASQGLEVPPIAYALLFALLGLIGFFTLIKLVRLRQAWYDSALAMSQIKDFYLERFPNATKAFRWKTDTLPALGKAWTITFNLALLIVIIDCVSIAIAAHAIGMQVSRGDYSVDVISALLFFICQIWFYFHQLPSSNRSQQ